MKHHQRFAQGQAAIEFTLAAPAILALAALGLEGLHIHNKQHRLHAALLHATRAGSVGHNQPELIRHHFIQALGSAYQSPGNWQIRILSPRLSDFQKLHTEVLQVSPKAQAVIDNDYQYLAPSEHQAELKAANVLELELYYAYQPWHPLLRLASKRASPAPTQASHLGQGALLKRTISLPMQSHPMLWYDLPDKSVIFLSSNSDAINRAQAPDPYIAPTPADPGKHSSLPTYDPARNNRVPSDLPPAQQAPAYAESPFPYDITDDNPLCHAHSAG